MFSKITLTPINFMLDWVTHHKTNHSVIKIKIFVAICLLTTTNGFTNKLLAFVKKTNKTWEKSLFSSTKVMILFSFQTSFWQSIDQVVSLKKGFKVLWLDLLLNNNISYCKIYLTGEASWTSYVSSFDRSKVRFCQF